MIYDMIVILITLPYNLVFLLLFQDLKNKNTFNESCMTIHVIMLGLINTVPHYFIVCY